MGRKFRADEFWKDRLSVAIGLGLCCLPLVFFVAAVFFGVQIAWWAVAVAFVVILIVCNALCRFRSHGSNNRNGGEEIL